MKFMPFNLIVFTLFTLSPVGAVGNGSVAKSAPAHGQFLNHILHQGGSHPASHAELIQGRSRTKFQLQREVPIQFEWLHEQVPNGFSDENVEPLETFEHQIPEIGD